MGDSQCPNVQAFDINASGQSVGLSRGPDGQNHFVSWTEEGAVTDLGVAAGSGWPAPRIAINDRGQITGSAGGQAFFWSDGVAHPLGSLGGGHTQVVDLNQDGLVVGMGSTANGEQHVFIWSEARGMIDLGTGPQGLSGAWATGINNRGDVIGMSAQCVRPSADQECGPPDQPRATLWRVQQ
jgi:probable HAF family extracellular repeat protein